MGGDDNRRMDTPITLSGFARLGYLGCIRVAGPDAAAFLQSQLTNDMTRLGADRARLSGFCSAKGRLQASFIAWARSDDEIVLACAADLLEPTLKRLSMFVLRSKCRLSDASAELPIFGIAGRDAEALVGQVPVWGRVNLAAGSTPGAAPGSAIRLPDGAGHALALWMADAGALGATPPSQPIDEAAWRWLLLHSGLPIIEAATRELFVPQMINLELLGGVDFQKGCYPGQEVVARSQYRGTLKRRMFLFDCDGPAAPGQEVFSPKDTGQPVGLVVNAAPRPGQTGSTLLAEVKLAFAGDDDLRLGSDAGAALHRRPLPYQIPLPADAAA